MHDLSAGAWLNLCVANVKLLDWIKYLRRLRRNLRWKKWHLSGKYSGLRVKKRDLRGRK